MIGVPVVDITKNKNILVCGCSFTHDSGFTPDNFKKYHYTSVLSARYPINFNNVGIGGLSNREISLRTIENMILSSKQFDAVIVQWTSLSRWWYYEEQNNIDDFTSIVNNNIFGRSAADAKLLGKILITRFNNRYMLLKQWLLDCISIANLLENKVPYRFCLGFNNLLSEFNNAEYSPGHGFRNLSEELVDILDLHQRPDSYILDKFNVIKDLIEIVNQLNWVNFPDAAWFEGSTIDVADDNAHPGIESNLLWANSLDSFISDLCVDK